MAHADQIIEVSGKTYVVMYEQMPGLWMVCERDNPNTQPMLRDARWIESGRDVPPTASTSPAPPRR